MGNQRKIYVVVSENRKKVYGCYANYDNAHSSTGWGLTDGVVLEFDLADGRVSDPDKEHMG